MSRSVRIAKSGLALLLAFTTFGLRTPGQAVQKVKLEEGTQVRLKLMEPVNSGTAQAGQVISFEVLDDVRVGEQLVIAEGAAAWGTIVEAEAGRRMGRAGKLAFRLDYVKAVDGSKVPLRATSVSQGKGKGVATGIAVGASAVLFWPAAPFFLLMKGKSSEVPRGYHVAAFVDGDRLVTPRGVEEMNAPAAMPTAGAAPGFVQASLNPATAGAVAASPRVAAEFGAINVISDPGGAEVEIDGAYYGNTPGLIRLPAGLHTITIRYGSHAPWKRTINIGPGSNLTVKADLQQSSDQTPPPRRND